jgi:hypothetical protein
LLPPTVTTPTNTTKSGWSYFIGTQTFRSVFVIYPTLSPQDQLLNAYTYAYQPPFGCPTAVRLASAAAALNTRLQNISATIQAREAALAGLLPQFTFLDPAKCPSTLIPEQERLPIANWPLQWPRGNLPPVLLDFRQPILLLPISLNILCHILLFHRP